MELLNEVSISRWALSRPCVMNTNGEMRSAQARRSPARDADHPAPARCAPGLVCFVNSVLNGKGQMPLWCGALTEEEIETMWARGSRQFPVLAEDAPTHPMPS